MPFNSSEKRTVYNKMVWARDKIKRKDIHKKWYNENREKQIAKVKKYREENKDGKYVKTYLTYARKHREEKRITTKKWRERILESMSEVQRKRQIKDWGLRKRYNISIEEYEIICKKQKGLCAICNKEPKVLNVDHDHKTGKNRELLCNKCNMGLGSANDSIEILKNMINYIRKHT